MPRFVSKEGIWIPKKEKVALEKKNPETGEVEPYIYEGPDRAALKMLKDMNAEEDGYIGTHFTLNPDMYELARQRGYDNVEEMMEKLGYNAKRAKEIAQKKLEEYTKHEAPERKPAAKFRGGGVNTASDSNIEDRYGGFGEPPKE